MALQCEADGQMCETVDRTSQRIADLDEVTQSGDDELGEKVFESREYDICNHEVRTQAKQVDGSECQNFAEAEATILCLLQQEIQAHYNK